MTRGYSLVVSVDVRVRRLTETEAPSLIVALEVARTKIDCLEFSCSPRERCW